MAAEKLHRLVDSGSVPTFQISTTIRFSGWLLGGLHSIWTNSESMGGDVKHKPSRLWEDAHASEGFAHTSASVGTLSLALRRLKTSSFLASLQITQLCVSPLLLPACSSLRWNSAGSSLQWSYEKMPEIAEQKDKEKENHELAVIPPSPKLTPGWQDLPDKVVQVSWIQDMPDSSYSLGEQSRIDQVQLCVPRIGPP